MTYESEKRKAEEEIATEKLDAVKLKIKQRLVRIARIEKELEVLRHEIEILVEEGALKNLEDYIKIEEEGNSFINFQRGGKSTSTALNISM